MLIEDEVTCILDRHTQTRWRGFSRHPKKHRDLAIQVTLNSSGIFVFDKISFSLCLSKLINKILVFFKYIKIRNFLLGYIMFLKKIVIVMLGIFVLSELEFCLFISQAEAAGAAAASSARRRREAEKKQKAKSASSQTHHGRYWGFPEITKVEDLFP